MNTSSSILVVVVRLCLGIFGALLVSTPLFGQLFLESIQPAHGSENVSTDMVLVWRFSEPLDTTMEYEASGGFYVGFEVNPSLGDPESVSLSPDKRTITAAFKLPENTTYRMLISGAQSVSGEPLDRPYACTFSTGDLPRGSISGTVSFAPPGSPVNSVVMLLPDHFFADFVRPEGQGDSGDEEEGLGFRAVGVVLTPEGHYTVEYIDEGLYALGVFKDLNQDGVPGPDPSGEGIGFYDGEGDRVPDLIQLEAGAELENLDVVLAPPLPYTARSVFDDARALAVSRSADARFFAVGGRDLTNSGEGIIWVYGFYSEIDQDTLGTLAFFQYLYPLDRANQGSEVDVDPTSPIEVNWIDSDLAVAAAEAAGGAQFRQNHPESLVDVVLHVAPGWVSHYSEQSKSEAAIAVWSLFYYDKSSGQLFPVVVDAESGEVLFAPGLQPTAATSVNAAKDFATAWYPDAQLVTVRSVTPLDSAGRSPVWSYLYFSAASAMVHEVVMADRAFAYQQDVEPSVILSTMPLPASWLDSDTVEPVAENASADFRSRYPDAQVLGRLSYGPIQQRPDLAVWEFTFRSEMGQRSLVIYVDAQSGQVTTASEPTSPTTSAGEISVRPNPFGAFVTLHFDLDEPGPVSLTIHNMLGQKVRSLVAGIQSAGRQDVLWDGRSDGGYPLPAGLYLYRLESKSVSTVGAMIRMR